MTLPGLQVTVHDPGRVHGGERLRPGRWPAASSAQPRSGRLRRTTSSSVWPGTYLVTMYGDLPVHVGVEDLGHVTGC